MIARDLFRSAGFCTGAELGGWIAQPRRVALGRTDRLRQIVGARALCFLATGHLETPRTYGDAAVRYDGKPSKSVRPSSCATKALACIITSWTRDSDCLLAET